MAGPKAELPSTVGAKISYSLNSLKGGYIGNYVWDYYRGCQGGY